MVENFDVVIIGGGVSGLLSAQKLSELGLKVALLEKHETLASGPSTRNEGWLHRGTYHSVSIKDHETAVEVAKRCIYGHQQIKLFAPEAIESGQRPLALLRDEAYLPEVLSRWGSADVQYRRLSHVEAGRVIPDAAFDRASAIFEVGEASINTRILYQKILSRARIAGCTFYLGHEITSISGNDLTSIGVDGSTLKLKAEKFVYAAGTGVKQLFKTFHDVDLPVRYWKSHLIITKRLATTGVFYLDAQEAAMMHHGNVTIVGFNEDAVLSERPSYEVIDENIINVERGLRRIFPSWSDKNSKNVACVKVDLATAASTARSLNIAITEPVPGHIIIMPGKMTEAPFLVDGLITLIHNEEHSNEIALRPCDNFPSQVDCIAL